MNRKGYYILPQTSITKAIKKMTYFKNWKAYFEHICIKALLYARIATSVCKAYNHDEAVGPVCLST